MPMFASILRCLMVMTICLDGNALLWAVSRTAMEAAPHLQASVHGAANLQRNASGAAGSIQHCSSTTTPEHSNDRNEGCDHARDGYDTILDTFEVAALAPTRFSRTQALIALSTISQGHPAALLRPPIG